MLHNTKILFVLMKNKIKLPKVDPTRVIKLNEGCDVKFNFFDVILNKFKKSLYSYGD